MKKIPAVFIALVFILTALSHGFAEDLLLQEQLQASIISGLVKTRVIPDKITVSDRLEQLPATAAKQDEAAVSGENKKRHFLEIAALETAAGFLSPYIVAKKCLQEITGGKAADKTGIAGMNKKAMEIEQKKYWSEREVGQDEYVNLSEEARINENLGQKVFSSLFSPYIGGVFLGAMSFLAFPATVPYAVYVAGKSTEQRAAYWPALMGSLSGIAFAYSIDGKYDTFHTYCYSVLGSVLFYNLFELLGTGGAEKSSRLLYPQLLLAENRFTVVLVKKL